MLNSVLYFFQNRQANPARRHRVLGLIAILLLSAAPTRAAEPGRQFWQFTLAYDVDSFSLVKIDPIAPMKKVPRTPGANSAPIRIPYDVAWFAPDGSALATTRAVLPVGQRIILQDNTPCIPYVPAADAIVVRIPGPAVDQRPASVRFTRAGAVERAAGDNSLEIPSAFSRNDFQIKLPPIEKPPQPVPGPLGVEKIRDTGDDRNRLVVVVLGDGYTSANLAAGSFETHTTDATTYFFGKAPWDSYLGTVNIYRIDVESNEEGADEPPPGPGIYVDTYFDASFWTSGIERLLAISATGRARAFAAADSLVGAGVWDEIMILVNSTKYGGAGGTVAVASVHPSGPEILLHEFGHSFGGLADEYETGGSGPPGNDSEPNVDFDASGPGLKWLIWVEAGTPLPTPETSTYNNVVGTFEGAKYWATGIYRPWLNCEMRSLSRPFCPVCSEAHVLNLMDEIDIADRVFPDPALSHPVHAGGVDFGIDPISITPLEYTWSVGGSALAGETSSTITLTAAHLATQPGTTTLQLDVAHPTSLVRRESIGETYTWTVVAQPSGIAPDVWTKY